MPERKRLPGIDWTKLGSSVSEVVMIVLGDHYGLYGRILPADTDLIDDLGSDWVDLEEVLMTMEELFTLRFDPAVSSTVRTVADVVTLVERGLGLQPNSNESQGSGRASSGPLDRQVEGSACGKSN
jgi:acyl carrier protein